MNVDPLNSIQGFPTVGASLGGIQSRDAKQGGKYEMPSETNDKDEVELSEDAENVPKHQSPGADQIGTSTAGGDGELDVTV